MASKFEEPKRQIDQELKAIIKEVNKDIFKEGMSKAMDIVGIEAVEKYMIATSFPGTKTQEDLRKMVNKQHVHSTKVTIRTGRLSRSLLNQFFRGVKEGIRRVKKTSGKMVAEIGSRVPYARVHEKGGSTGRTTIKARPYLKPALKTSKEPIKKMFRKLIVSANQKVLKKVRRK